MSMLGTNAAVNAATTAASLATPGWGTLLAPGPGTLVDLFLLVGQNLPLVERTLWGKLGAQPPTPTTLAAYDAMAAAYPRQWIDTSSEANPDQGYWLETPPRPVPVPEVFTSPTPPAPRVVTNPPAQKTISNPPKPVAIPVAPLPLTLPTIPPAGTRRTAQPEYIPAFVPQIATRVAPPILRWFLPKIAPGARLAPGVAPLVPLAIVPPLVGSTQLPQEVPGPEADNQPSERRQRDTNDDTCPKPKECCNPCQGPKKPKVKRKKTLPENRKVCLTLPELQRLILRG